MSDLSEFEKGALAEFLAKPSTLRDALEKFLESRRQHMLESCQSEMKTVPRNHESASDYAAQAEAYQTFMAHLELFSKNA